MKWREMGRVLALSFVQNLRSCLMIERDVTRIR